MLVAFAFHHVMFDLWLIPTSFGAATDIISATKTLRAFLQGPWFQQVLKHPNRIKQAPSLSLFDTSKMCKWVLSWPPTWHHNISSKTNTSNQVKLFLGGWLSGIPKPCDFTCLVITCLHVSCGDGIPFIRLRMVMATSHCDHPLNAITLLLYWLIKPRIPNIYKSQLERQCKTARPKKKLKYFKPPNSVSTFPNMYIIGLWPHCLIPEMPVRISADRGRSRFTKIDWLTCSVRENWAHHFGWLRVRQAGQHKDTTTAKQYPKQRIG